MNMSLINYQAAKLFLENSDGKLSIEQILDFKLHRALS